MIQKELPTRGPQIIGIWFFSMHCTHSNSIVANLPSARDAQYEGSPSMPQLKFSHCVIIRTMYKCLSFATTKNIQDTQSETL